MDKPKLKLSKWISFIIGIEGLILTVSSLFSWSMAWLSFAAITGLVVVLLFSFFDFYKQTMNFYTENNKVYNRHQALSEQFDRKNDLLSQYETAFDHMGHSILIAKTVLKKNEKQQIDNLYSLFLTHNEKIEGAKDNVR